METEVYIEKLRKLRDEYQEEHAILVGGLTDKFSSNMKVLTDRYIEENALFGVGDIIKSSSNAIMKVDRINCFFNYHFNSFTITYVGLPYKKLGGEFVRTKIDKESIFREETTKLLKKTIR